MYIPGWYHTSPNHAVHVTTAESVIFYRQNVPLKSQEDQDQATAYVTCAHILIIHQAVGRFRLSSLLAEGAGGSEITLLITSHTFIDGVVGDHRALLCDIVFTMLISYVYTAYIGNAQGHHDHPVNPLNKSLKGYDSSMNRPKSFSMHASCFNLE